MPRVILNVPVEVPEQDTVPWCVICQLPAAACFHEEADAVIRDYWFWRVLRRLMGRE